MYYCSGPPTHFCSGVDTLPRVEQRTGLQLAESQKTAIRKALIAKVLVLTGGPGVGKTTIVNSSWSPSKSPRNPTRVHRPEAGRVVQAGIPALTGCPFHYLVHLGGAEHAGGGLRHQPGGANKESSPSKRLGSGLA